MKKVTEVLDTYTVTAEDKMVRDVYSDYRHTNPWITRIYKTNEPSKVQILDAVAKVQSKYNLEIFEYNVRETAVDGTEEKIRETVNVRPSASCIYQTLEVSGETYKNYVASLKDDLRKACDEEAHYTSEMFRANKEFNREQDRLKAAIKSCGWDILKKIWLDKKLSQHFRDATAEFAEIDKLKNKALNEVTRLKSKLAVYGNVHKQVFRDTVYTWLVDVYMYEKGDIEVDTQENCGILNK